MFQQFSLNGTLVGVMMEVDCSRVVAYDFVESANELLRPRALALCMCISYLVYCLHSVFSIEGRYHVLAYVGNFLSISI